MKSQIRAGREPWKSAFDACATACPAPKRPAGNILDFQPHAFAHVVRGSYGRPAIGGAELSASADTAYRAALHLVCDWRPCLRRQGDRDHPLRGLRPCGISRTTTRNCCGLDRRLMVQRRRNSPLHRRGLEKEGIAEFERMLRTVYQPLPPLLFPEANGNWDAAIMDSLLRCPYSSMTTHCSITRLNISCAGRAIAGITKYVYPSGQCQETTRDSGHTQLGLGYLIQTAQVAWTQGVDLFGAADNRPRPRPRVFRPV